MEQSLGPDGGSSLGSTALAKGFGLASAAAAATWASGTDGGVPSATLGDEDRGRFLAFFERGRDSAPDSSPDEASVAGSSNRVAGRASAAWLDRRAAVAAAFSAFFSALAEPGRGGPAEEDSSDFISFIRVIMS